MRASLRPRQRHEEAGQELARHIAPDAHGGAGTRRPRSSDAQRQEITSHQLINAISAPNGRSASTRSPIGRSRMRGTPSTSGNGHPRTQAPQPVFASTVPTGAEEEVGLLDRERTPRAGHLVAAVTHAAPVDAERAATRRASPWCRRIRAVPSGVVVPLAPAPPATACDSRCFSNRAAVPCRRHGAPASARVNPLCRARSPRRGERAFPAAAPSPLSISLRIDAELVGIELQLLQQRDRGSPRRCRATSRDGWRRCA